jgi:hypothetical protein
MTHGDEALAESGLPGLPKSRAGPRFSQWTKSLLVVMALVLKRDGFTRTQNVAITRPATMLENNTLISGFEAKSSLWPTVHIGGGRNGKSRRCRTSQNNRRKENLFFHIHI